MVCVLLSHSLFTCRDCVFSCTCFVIACLFFLFSLQFVFWHLVDIDSNPPLSVCFCFSNCWRKPLRAEKHQNMQDWQWLSWQQVQYCAVFQCFIQCCLFAVGLLLLTLTLPKNTQLLCGSFFMLHVRTTLFHLCLIYIY